MNHVIMTILLYIAIMNVVGLAIMGIDKWKAKRGAFRIPESTLFIIAIIGGSLGSILGMYLFRHKTRHWYFVYGMPLILILQLALIYLLTHSGLEFTIM